MFNAEFLGQHNHVLLIAKYYFASKHSHHAAHLEVSWWSGGCISVGLLENNYMDELTWRILFSLAEFK